MPTRVKPSTAIKATSLAWLRDPATSAVFRDTANDHLLYVFAAAWHRFAQLPHMHPVRATLNTMRSQCTALLPKGHVATDLQLKVAAASLVAFLEKNMDPAVKEKMIKNSIDLIHPDLQALADGGRPRRHEVSRWSASSVCALPPTAITRPARVSPPALRFASHRSQHRRPPQPTRRQSPCPGLAGRCSQSCSTARDSRSRGPPRPLPTAARRCRPRPLPRATRCRSSLAPRAGPRSVGRRP